MLDADILVTAVTKAAKGLNLLRIGPKQPSRGRGFANQSKSFTSIPRMPLTAAEQNLAGPPQFAKPRTPFLDEIRAMAREDHGSFTPSDRKVLTHLAGQPKTEAVWTQIEKTCGKEPSLLRRFYIGEIVRNRNLAMPTRHWPDYRKAAVHAESLAKFLRGSGGLPPPLPMIGLFEGIDWLEKTAPLLRAQADIG